MNAIRAIAGTVCFLALSVPFFSESDQPGLFEYAMTGVALVALAVLFAVTNREMKQD